MDITAVQKHGIRVSRSYLKPRPKENKKSADLEGELRAAKVCLLLLPEVVRFDDEGHADLGREKLLQRLQQRLDQLPLGPAHVDDDGKAPFTHVLAGDGHSGQGPEGETMDRI